MKGPEEVNMKRALVMIAASLATVLAGCKNGGGKGDGEDALDTPPDADVPVDGDVPADGDVPIDGDVAEPGDAELDETGEPVFPEEHPRIYLNEANRARLDAALAGGSPAAARFRDMVDAEMGGADYYAFSPWFAALLGALTGDGAYCTYAVEGTEAWVAAEEALIGAGERAEVAADSYLYVGDHVGNLALVYDWCWDSLTTEQRDRWLAYANQAVWNVWHPEEAIWGGVSYPWSGWSIDNPSNNYYYSFLRATLLLGLAARGERADAEGWITLFRDTKIGGQLVPTFESDLQGGGSREGSGYGVSMAKLFELYDIWEASTGERIHDLTGHTRASLANFLHLTVPTMDRIAPVGDHARDSTAALFDYHRNYVQILTFLYRGDALAPFGKYFLNHCSVPEMDQAFMYVYDFLYDEPSVVEAPLEGMQTAYWAPGTGQLYQRSSWGTDATWVHLIAGPYTESHAHRDQGSLLFYRGEWLAYDQNIASHSGIRQEEELHNLVRITQGGAAVQQHAGGAPAVLTALTAAEAYGYAAADVTPIYGGDGGITKAEREIVFVKPDVLVVFDRLDAASGTERVFQVNSPIEPSLGGSAATFAGSAATLVVTTVLPAGAAMSVLDWTTDDDMNGGYRLDVTDAGAGGRTRFLHVFSVDGAAASISSSPDGTMLGVEVQLAAGGRAVVRFEADAAGGTLQIFDSGGAAVVDTPLAAGVNTPPVP
jgi:hypothetical protein